VSEIDPAKGVQNLYTSWADQANHARCIGDELDRTFCENFLPGYKLRAGDVVAFGDPDGNRPCAHGENEVYELQRAGHLQKFREFHKLEGYETEADRTRGAAVKDRWGAGGGGGDAVKTAK